MRVIRWHQQSCIHLSILSVVAAMLNCKYMMSQCREWTRVWRDSKGWVSSAVLCFHQHPLTVDRNRRRNWQNRRSVYTIFCVYFLLADYFVLISKNKNYALYKCSALCKPHPEYYKTLNRISHYRDLDVSRPRWTCSWKLYLLSS